MANVPRIHCHSAFKHYHMYHNRSSRDYGSVFNTTYNFNGGGFSGGGFWGGLMGGLGMGLGAGLMNLFGGLFGGGMFHGMGMFGGGMFGGFPMMGGLWGGYGGSRTGDGAGGKAKESKTKEKVVETKCNNKDDKILNDLRVELNGLKAKDNLTQQEITALQDKVKKAKGDSDTNHKTEDDRAYDLLLEDIGKLKPKTKVATQSPSKTQPTNPSSQTANNNAISINNNKLTLHFAQNEKAGIDKTIKGDIIGIKRNSSNQVESYIIKCNAGKDGNTFGLVYQVTVKDLDSNGRPTSYNVKCLSTEHKAKNSNNKPYTLYCKGKGITYKLGQSGYLESENGDETNITISDKDKQGKKKADYKSIKYKADAADETLDSLGLTGYDVASNYKFVNKDGYVTAERKQQS